jgi:hypothetical protein
MDSRTSSRDIAGGTPWRRMKDALWTNGRADEKIMTVITRLMTGSK